jgi:hypothetical protein
MRLRTPLILAAFIVTSYVAPRGLGQDVGVHWQEDAAGIGLSVNAIAPDFSLPDQTGVKRSVASLMGPRGVALVFIRSADW